MCSGRLSLLQRLLLSVTLIYSAVSDALCFYCLLSYSHCLLLHSHGLRHCSSNTFIQLSAEVCPQSPTTAQISQLVRILLIVSRPLSEILFFKTNRKHVRIVRVALLIHSTRVLNRTTRLVFGRQPQGSRNIPAACFHRCTTRCYRLL